MEPWSLALMESAAAAALALLVFRDVPRGRIQLLRVPGLLPLLLLIGFVTLQILPLPAVLVKLVSPSAYRVNAATVGLFRPVEWLPLSLARGETAAEALRLAASGVVYVLTVQLLGGGDRMRRTVYGVMTFATFLSVLAILQYLTDSHRIYWFRELTAGGTPFGPYVNRNHYAGLMEMVFPVALSVFLASRPSTAAGSPREQLADFLSHPRFNIHVLSGLGCVVIATSIFLSLSRGGIISLCLSLTIFGMMLLARRGGRRRGMVMVAVCVVIILSVGWFGWQPVFDRFDRIRDDRGEIADARKVIWQDSLRLIRDYPAVGAGFGSFAAVYPRYRSLEGVLIADHAHNDYIELLAGGGLASLGLMAWFLAAVFHSSWRTFRGRRDPFAVYLFMGAVSGTCAILIHGMTDFNLQIGANGLYFFFLAGLAVSAAHTRLHAGGRGETLLREAPSAMLRWIRPAAALFAVGTLCLGATTLLAGYYYGVVAVIRPGAAKDRPAMERVREVAQRAAALSPLEPRYRAALGDVELMLGAPEAAAAAHGAAVSLCPSSGINLQRLGMAYAAMQQQGMARLLLQAGLAAEPRNPAVRRGYGLWLLGQGQREEGISALRDAAALEPERMREYIALLVLQGLRDEEIAGALPPLVGPHLIFADYLARTGRDAGAAEAYRNAVQYLASEQHPKPGHFLALSRFFMRIGAHDEAMKVIRQGVAVLPLDAGLRLAAAEAYAAAGMPRRAAEEYRAVLLMDPGNAAARRALGDTGR